MLATEYGHVDVILALMKKNVDPKQSKFRLPLLLLAAKNGHANVVELFCERFPKMMEAKSAPPKVRGRKRFVHLLINLFFKGRSALHVACKMGRAKVCAILLELGMDPNLVSGDGFSPIHLASTPEG